MCPCLLVDKLKNAFGKKKKGKSKESNRSDDSATSPVEPIEKKKEKSKKSKKSKRSENSKGKSKKARSNMKSPDVPSSDPNSLSSRASKPDLVINHLGLLGQVIHNKPEPKNYIRDILKVERPDLMGSEGILDDGEIKTLDDYLLKGGEMRDGVSLTLGEIVDCDSSARVGKGEDVTIVLLYANGRFGSVYLVHRQADSEQQRAGMSNAMALKTSRRLAATVRMQHEVKTLLGLFNKSSAAAKAKIPLPTHITPIFFHGTSCGTPYFIMPMMDANLEKIKQDIGQRFPWVDAFYIGQEALIGIKQCHEHSIIHRDIKPTNLLLSIQNNKNWWLCDFGDSCSTGEVKILSPPDALTLPYLSRTAHQSLQKPTKATISMDIESWLYLFIDLFIVLPWKNKVEEAETLEAKNAFWSSTTQFIEKNTSKVPPQLLPIIQIVGNSSIDKPYAQLTTLLREGFNQNNKNPPWKPFWIEKRKKTAPPPKTPANDKKEKDKKSSTVSASAGTTQTSENPSKNEKTSGKLNEAKSKTKSVSKSISKG
ncbi:hypothetical protein GCK72_010085 [Caenorhabditis remanei]|uniref:non-specific serine/threonine protein kinase n=1 Tax=Caenorhabditis remanei TaxID=31234 RepID=A0A6A5H2B1_CAERE|nr:hypothetical protein GCK72_010085 [Caenorhabditis remanei]KAF1761828.1 hypothetical protein GCK72_010085 [Caenorhabditis remanei]